MVALSQPFGRFYDRDSRGLHTARRPRARQTAAAAGRVGSGRRTLGGRASRGRYAQGVYTASKWPPNQQMCMHHELSYAHEVPSLMLFACLVAPAVGGATPLADGAAVFDALPRDLVERFERQGGGWLLIRNYNDDIGATVADVF